MGDFGFNQDFCEGCEAAKIERAPSNDDVTTTLQFIQGMSVSMWRRNWRKGNGIEAHGYRKTIMNGGFSYSDAELVWNCAVNRYFNRCPDNEAQVSAPLVYGADAPNAGEPVPYEFIEQE